MELNNEELEDEFYDSEASFIEGDEINEQQEEQDQNNVSLTQPTPKLIYAVQFLNKNNDISNNNNNNNNNNLKVSAIEQQKKLATPNRIFINADSAKNLCKQDPDNRRFKVFRNFLEAYTFSYETSEIESGQAPSLHQLEASLNASNQNQTESSNVNSSNANQDVEKLPFSAPKKSEINLLRSHIEKNEFEIFKQKVLSNPRFLISSGDAPIVVQEAFRYNCLHSCAKENRHQFCKFILNTLNSSSFIQMLYRNDTIEQAKNRSKHMLDWYLNTPEKGLGETPLHFACKFGSYECAKVLLSFQACDRNALNKHNKMAHEIICTKATNQSAKDKFDLRKSLFEDCFYVKLYRDNDKGDVIVDRPSPKLTSYLQIEETKTTPGGSMPNHKLAGYVGPVSPNLANEIYERIKTPGRLRQSPNNRNILRSDEFKGYERITRTLTHDMNLPWREYWSFLDSYLDLNTQQGYSKLETYFKQKKLLSMLNFQIKSVQNILNNNNDYNSEMNLNFDTQLKQFISIIEKIKVRLDLKENLLSKKFELFLKIIELNQINLNTCFPIKISNSKSATILEDENDENNVNNGDTIDLDEFEIILNQILTEYLSLIIRISQSENKCYFYLYKTSKSIFELFNCEKLFQVFYFSPAFKNKYQRTLMKQETKIDDLSRKLNYDEDDFIEKKEYVKDDLDEVESIFTSLNLNDSQTEHQQKFDLISNSNNNKNSKNHLKPKKYTHQNKNQNLVNNTDTEMTNSKQLFVIGDLPSKIDRSVYICLQNNFNQIDQQEKYPMLTEWYNYMRNVKQSEMQDWKTPVRTNQVQSRLKIF